MNKNHKTKNHQGKQHNYQRKYCWVVCVYLFTPIILILFFDKVFTPLLQDFMSSVRIEKIVISNSEYVRNNIVYPFCKSLAIIMGAIASYGLLGFLQKKLLKRRIYFVGSKKILKCLEIITVLLTVSIAVYNKTNNFDHSQYGYSTDTIRKAVDQEEGITQIPLEKIPSIHSTGLETSKGNLLYKILLHTSQFIFYLSDNLEMAIAIAGTVIIPLKNYSEEIERKKNV